MERAQTRIDRDLLDAVRERAAEEGRDEEEVEEALGRYECPRSSCSSLVCWPFMNLIVAHVCLSSWKAISGSPARPVPCEDRVGSSSTSGTTNFLQEP